MDRNAESKLLGLFIAAGAKKYSVFLPAFHQLHKWLCKFRGWKFQSPKKPSLRDRYKDLDLDLDPQ